ncbi:hypothetical protein PSI23_20680 [Xenorhabdus sp. XENO-10]|uniref:Uncharacterized protein n=1 Tax=Xenorhabdus yunnanensis TaxID=3025878 RepID=A0ABT5LMD6_9GAMM|nr:hypothetical protein [Xenorhabdus yunnanensis]MDC9591628.1 hypothetical protein [Xenorhabdus yunnanensis]
MKLYLKMWIEDENHEEIIVFKYIDNGNSSSLIYNDEELLLASIDRTQKIINSINSKLQQGIKHDK